jgi:hypothetical protein
MNALACGQYFACLLLTHCTHVPLVFMYIITLFIFIYVFAFVPVQSLAELEPLGVTCPLRKVIDVAQLVDRGEWEADAQVGAAEDEETHV